MIKGRLRHCADFWKTLNPPDWVLDVVRFGVKIPFEKEPPRMILPNNRSCLENKSWVRQTIMEFVELGFVKKEDNLGCSFARPNCMQGPG